MIGQTLGRYLILEQIGAGGMGVVYRSRDERLNRDVALKVLPAGKLSDDASRKRFRREALALAKLNHPNIGTVYDFDTQGDVDFLVMEYIHGETLKERLAQGSLPEKEVVGLGLQIASALEEAHEHGVVHRDLKPGNIMVTSKGQAKVLDFGLARLLEANGEGDATQTLTQTDAGGTLPYMSPEQLRGGTVDARTDVFASGVVLYEMTAGRRPFQEKQPARLIQQILAEAPPSPREVNPRLSSQLESIILKAIDKEPNLRYQSARELRVDLERLATQQTSSSAVSPVLHPGTLGRVLAMIRVHPRVIYLSALVLLLTVASLWWYARPVLSFAPRDWVLLTDFDNQTGDPLFDRSLATALTVSLEQSSHVNVVPRARIAMSLRRMKKAGDEKINEELAREISVRENVRAVLSCAIARVGQQYALTARLVDPQSGTAVRSYLEQAKDQDHILDALGSIATRIRRDLGESLLAMRKSDRPLPLVTTRSLQALRLYAEASALWSKGQYDQAMQSFEAALQADPDFAMAHAAVGGALYSHIYNNPTLGKEHFDKALQLSERTTDRERLSIQTSYVAEQGHITDAVRLYNLYLQSYPDDWSMHYNYAFLLRTNDKEEEALEQYKEILRLYPSSPSTYIDIATSYSGLGNNAEALRNYEQAFKLDPSWETNQNINHEYGMAVFRSGDEAKAREVFALALAKPDLKARGLRSLAWVDLYHGKYASAKPRLQEALVLDQVKNWGLSMVREHNLLAMVAAGQGDRAGALKELAVAAPLLPTLGPQVYASLWIGTQYARNGEVSKAAEILERIRPLGDLSNPDQARDLQILEGEVELARGNNDRAIELFTLADKQKRNAMTLEGLARTYDRAGNLEKAIEWYENFLGEREAPLGWEPQQDWIAAHYHVARAYLAKGDKTKAAAQNDWLLDAWKDADSGLPLLKDALALRQEIQNKP